MPGISAGLGGQVNNNIQTDGLVFYIDAAYSNADIENPQRAEMLAGIEGVGLAESLLWAEDAFWNFRGELLNALSRVPPAVDGLTNVVQMFVDQEKTPIERRKRMVLTFRLAAYFHRALLRWAVHADAGLPEDHALDSEETLSLAVSAASQSLSQGDGNTIDILIRIVDRSLAAAQQTEQNANPSTVIGCWADDLNACLTGIT